MRAGNFSAIARAAATDAPLWTREPSGHVRVTARVANTYFEVRLVDPARGGAVGATTARARCDDDAARLGAELCAHVGDLPEGECHNVRVALREVCDEAAREGGSWTRGFAVGAPVGGAGGDCERGCTPIPLLTTATTCAS